jgi:dihydrolipoamide dehydrogenase
MNQEQMERYDLCVLGAGPAGYAGAMRAIDFGKKVCLVEKNRVGGAGVYNGALGSKTLWELSQKVHAVNETIAKVGREKFSISWEEASKTRSEAIFDRKFQYSCHINLLENETSNRIFTYERGTATLLDNHMVQIAKEDGTTQIIWADQILIATGSSPRGLPNTEVDGKVIMTSDHIHHIDDYPKSLVVVGAGVIGCEYATIFSNFGKTKVYLIDRADRILPAEDEDISTMVSDNLENKGAVIHHNAKLERLERVGDEVEYELSYPDGLREVIRVEKALLSIGRTPNTRDLGLEKAEVRMMDSGHIWNEDTRTSVPNIYVAGDVSGRIALVNMGELEARHAVEKMFGGKTDHLSYDNVSTIMFLQPEVAAVGMNERQCREKNIPVKVVKIDYSCIARAIAMRKTQGFFKIIVTNDDQMKILGMRAIGEHASSAIQAVALLMKMDKGIEELAELIHPHPSIIEGIQECVRMLLNKSVFKSSVFKDKLQCYSCVEGVCTPLQRL